jgi:hypothetical protein
MPVFQYQNETIFNMTFCDGGLLFAMLALAFCIQKQKRRFCNT